MTAAPTPSKMASVYKMATEGRAEAACTQLLKLVTQSPGNTDVLALLVAVLAKLGRFEQALYYADRAVAADPRSRTAHSNRANLLMMMHRPEEGLRDMRAAIALDPRNLELRWALSQACLLRGLHDEALATLEEVKDRIEFDPRFGASYAGVLQAVGRADEAITIFKRLLLRDPQDPATSERLLGASVYALNITNAEIKEAAARYGRLVSVRMPVSRYEHPNDPSPDRRLRIGFISPDFREHASMRFFEPLAASYDKSAMEFRCYMTIGNHSPTTARIRGMVDHFASVEAMQIPDLAQKLRDEELDILIDLAGHTTGHRIDVFHHKPAPIQCTWYGQPVTTGLTSIDYRIVDDITDPPATESDNVERLLRIDRCGFVFWPVPGAPDVQDPPSQRADSPTRGTISFGSYNNLMKMNEPTFRLWARVLRAVPGSRLLLRHVAFGAPGIRKAVTDRLAAAGLGDEAAQRVVIGDPTMNAAEMMPMYHALDIALDTFPYSGMTTTGEALSMGVPVVTLPMNRSVARYSQAYLENMGLHDLVARDEDDYVRIAAGLANDPQRLLTLRHTLRGRMQETVGNAPDFARRFESTLRGAWRQWCAART